MTRKSVLCWMNNSTDSIVSSLYGDQHCQFLFVDCKWQLQVFHILWRVTFSRTYCDVRCIVRKKNSSLRSAFTIWRIALDSEQHRTVRMCKLILAFSVRRLPAFATFRTMSLKVRIVLYCYEASSLYWARLYGVPKECISVVCKPL